MKVTYESNNSGGSWWLDDEDWHALAEAGWEVEWSKDVKHALTTGEKDGRWLGALATKASREGLSLRDAIAEWERVTGERASALGCSCCGAPHYFILRDDDGKWVDSYSPSFPEYGEDY